MKKIMNKTKPIPTLRRLSCAAILSILAMLPIDAMAEKEEDEVSLLFVQNAKGIQFDAENATLTLKNVNPVVTFFSDRPDRIVGHVILEAFLEVWDECDDSFADDPPNAELSVLHGKEFTNAVVVLMNPRIKGDDLIYDVAMLDGELPKKGGPSTLFIDGLFSGGAGRSGLRGGVVGGLIGAATGDAGKGAAIGAAAGIVGGAVKSNRENTREAEDVASRTRTVNVPNGDGSYTPVNLILDTGGWQGPQGEIYPTLPEPKLLVRRYAS